MPLFSLLELTVLLLLAVFVCIKRKDTVRLKNTAFLAGVVLGACMTARVVLLFIEPQWFLTLHAGQILSSLIYGLRFDLPVLALTAGPFILLLNLPFRSRRWQQGILAAGLTVAAGVILLLIGDLVYFGYVRRHIHADIWNLFTSFSLIWSIAVRQYWYLLAAAGICLLALPLSGCWFARRNGTPVRGKWIWEILFLFILLWLLFLCVRNDFLSLRPLTVHRAYEQNLQQGHLTQNGVFSVMYALRPETFFPHVKQAGVLHPALKQISPRQAFDISRPMLLSPQEEMPEADYPFMRRRTRFNADASGKNLVILIIESLEYRYVDYLNGTHRGATPNIDALFKDSLVFDNFYAAVDDNSLGGVGTVLSGMPRIAGTGYFGNGMEMNSLSYLGHLFSAAGYTPWFVRSANDKWMFIGPLARLAGFDTYSAEDLRPRLSYAQKEPSDYEALQLLAEKLAASPQPFIAVFFSLGTHEPWGKWVPETFGEGLEKKFPKNSYLRGLAYTDWAIGRFIQTLKQNGLYEDTVFVLLGDHTNRKTVHTSLKESLHVPLAVRASGILPAGRTDILGGQADILPTLVDLFHIQDPYAALGNSLLDKEAPRFAFFSYMGGDHFGLITADGIVLENDKLFPSQQATPVERQKAWALNRAAYDLMQHNRWTKK